MENQTKSTAVNYGLYLGTILALVTIIAYSVKLELFVNPAFGIGVLVLTAILGTLSMIKSKKIQNGFITFKEAFTSYFITILIGILISTVISFVIFNYVDTDAAVQLKELALNTQVEMLRNFNQPEETIALVVEASEQQGNMYSIKNVITSLLGNIILFSIIGLIIALIVKRKPENE